MTGALEWLDRPTDCDVPRPHPPRKALMTNGIVIMDISGQLQPCFYLPATDEWYLLPATECRRLDMGHGDHETVSCQGKVFIITDDLARSQCYDPDSNRWSPVSWANKLSFLTAAVPALAVKNKICFFINEEFRSTALWIYSFDSNSLSSLGNWIDRACFCAVAVDRYIYVLGGNLWSTRKVLSECTRFDTEKNEWQKIAPLNEARKNALGACKNEKIFIAGGWYLDWFQVELLNTCEVYNILTDEWQFIASLALCRTLGSMVVVDETLYVLGGGCQSAGKFSDKVKYYNHEDNEWNDKATVPVNKITLREREEEPYHFKGCSLRVFKGVLTKLQSISE